MQDERDTGRDTADAEAHAVRAGRGNDDVAPQDGAERELAGPDADDDVEGHLARSGR